MLPAGTIQSELLPCLHAIEIEDPAILWIILIVVYEDRPKVTLELSSQNPKGQVAEERSGPLDFTGQLLKESELPLSGKKIHREGGDVLDISCPLSAIDVLSSPGVLCPTNHWHFQ